MSHWSAEHPQLPTQGSAVQPHDLLLVPARQASEEAKMNVQRRALKQYRRYYGYGEQGQAEYDPDSKTSPLPLLAPYLQEDAGTLPQGQQCVVELLTVVGPPMFEHEQPAPRPETAPQPRAGQLRP